MAVTLKAARNNTGLNQDEAAEKLGISSVTLHRYESGKSFPDVPTIKRIEALYGIPFSEIEFAEREE